MRSQIKIDENLYNEKSLYLLNIRELRDLGRMIGVPAPATLKKQDLVDYILNIVYGHIDAPKHSAFGRPNVREVDISQYLAKIKKRTDVNDQILGASFDDIDSIFKVASPDESSKANIVEQRTFVEEKGKFYLREFAFVACDGDVEVSKDIKNKFKLENFDIVEVIISGKSFKIISINGKAVSLASKARSKDLGKKQVFHLSTKEEVRKEIKKILKNSDENLKYVVFSAEDYSSEKVEQIKTDKKLSSEKAYKQFMSFVNLCEKYVYEGESIVVITDEADFVEETLNSLDTDVSNRTKKHLQTRINDLLALGNALIIYKLEKEAIYQ